MNTKPSVPLSPAPSDLPQLFKEAVSGFAAQLQRWFLPHMMAGIGLFLLVCYVTASTWFAYGAGLAKWVGVCVLFFVYALGAFVYSLITTCVFALRLACVHWSNFIEHVLEQVQLRAAAQVADWQVGLSKEEAKTLVRGSVRDVFSTLKPARKARLRGLLIFGLVLLSVATRAVLTAKIVKYSGRTIRLANVFASRATLVGAVFLNLHVLVTVLLVLCYVLGASVAVINIYLVFLLK